MAEPLPVGLADRDLVVSYLTLRRAIGALGMALPVLLIVGGLFASPCHCIQRSISAYYDVSHFSVIFTGSLFAIGFFLLTYRGFTTGESRLGTACWVLAVSVAIFPHDGRSPFGGIHFASAALLFAILAYYSFALFPKLQPGDILTEQKKFRNKVYKTSGAIMSGCLLALGVHAIIARVSGTDAETWAGVVWLESAILETFGFSWMIKGQTLWTDAGLPPRDQPIQLRRT
jgi:hypothetical protein